MATLNEQSRMPLYAQLAERLEGRITQGNYAAGERIPSEHSLAAEFAVGRPTVRQATELLLRRGYLERRRGAGTFVRPRTTAIDLFSLGGTIGSFAEKGVQLHTELLSDPQYILPHEELTQEPASLYPAPVLPQRPGYQLARLSSAQGEPVLLERFFFDAEIFPDFHRLDLHDRSLSDVVRTNYGLEASSADHKFSALLADKDDAKLLKIAEKSPLLQVQRSLHFRSARDAVLVHMLCRSDRYSFSQTIGAHHA